MAETIRLVLPSEAQMRAAVSARDPALDGVFVYGVVTTGVFCVPSCRARPARAENLRFFVDSPAAQRAGMRPCKRCRPLEAAARREQLFAIARYIHAHADEKLSLAGLARRCEQSPASFQRSFARTFGVSPKAYQDAARLTAFKRSLRAGDGVIDAVFGAGYGSTSRVYGAAARNLGMTPTRYRQGGAGEQIFYAHRTTSLGCLLMAATLRGVCFAELGDTACALEDRLRAEFPQAELLASTASTSVELDRWIDALDEHLSAHAPRPDVPLDLRGTAFQIRVWRYLLGTRAGDVVSYAEVAKEIGDPRAARAAAAACAANRVTVLVPCHRVLRGDGEMGGYRLGIERKRTLLDLERRQKAGSR